MLTLNTRPEDVSAQADDALASAPLSRVVRALADARIDDDAIVRAVSAVTENPATVEPLKAIHARLSLGDTSLSDGTFERVVLLRAMRVSLRHLETYPVSGSVKRLYGDEVRFVASPAPSTLSCFDLTRNVFVGLAKTATLRRFPAGQMTWEVSGIPRSWLPKVPVHSMPRLVQYLLKLGGLSPAFVPHLSATRRDRTALLERETNRSWYRMAQSMQLQPQIRGLVASSWLHSPDTMRATPHMTGFSRAPLENGALVIRHHRASLDCGVFYRSPERKKLYEEGQFTPTHGLVIWPRKEMLAWADSHPEFADPTS